jgi:hypothetical protein
MEQLRNGDCKTINEDSPGERTEISSNLVRGKYTVVEFSSRY